MWSHLAVRPKLASLLTTGYSTLSYKSCSPKIFGGPDIPVSRFRTAVELVSMCHPTPQLALFSSSTRLDFQLHSRSYYKNLPSSCSVGGWGDRRKESETGSSPPTFELHLKVCLCSILHPQKCDTNSIDFSQFFPCKFIISLENLSLSSPSHPPLLLLTHVHNAQKEDTSGTWL